jgi:hypothetical protein
MEGSFGASTNLAAFGMESLADIPNPMFKLTFVEGMGPTANKRFRLKVVDQNGAEKDISLSRNVSQKMDLLNLPQNPPEGTFIQITGWSQSNGVYTIEGFNIVEGH